MKNKLVTLIIMDGFGINPEEKGNAVKAANKVNLDYYMKKYPHSRLKTSGLAVGLPEGQMGTSEVGHMNMGAGRVVYQELARISKSIEDGEFFKKKEFLGAIENCKNHHSKLHLYGLLSTGGVHSHIKHLEALLKLAKMNDFSDVYIHCFLDGRDVPPTSGKGFLQDLQKIIAEVGVGKIATIMGRYYIMDRDKRWERLQLGYDAMVLGKGEMAEDPITAIQTSYDRNETDEFVKPFVMTENGKPVATIDANDSVIFFNFRTDRAREITWALMNEDFDDFKREKGYFPLYYVCMTQYDENLKNVEIAFKPEELKNKLGEYLSEKGYKQLRIAETEKYAHVTFFFNGGVEHISEGEDRILVPSPKVATYDMQPEMSAYEVAEKAVEAIDKKIYDVVILNFANPDMVGHTGNFDAAVKAVEVTDECVGKVVDAVLKQEGYVLITSDHGNADVMYDYQKNEPVTSHTVNDTPFLLIGAGDVEVREGALCDLAPTILELLGEAQPKEMTGKSLIVK
ncbi:MAG: 2,3-bisphosphoglycerate-independent phosphoglycerate mutase [Clostridia bacterium]|nr:2,3-bisphosphoglycerate-independent phosphoglycerate mutase [Clostridia bacterium]